MYQPGRGTDRRLKRSRSSLGTGRQSLRNRIPSQRWRRIRAGWSLAMAGLHPEHELGEAEHHSATGQHGEESLGPPAVLGIFGGLGSRE
ncbi:MAG: hypothetical protein ACK56F_05505, partial [bacterium]